MEGRRREGRWETAAEMGGAAAKRLSGGESDAVRRQRQSWEGRRRERRLGDNGRGETGGGGSDGGEIRRQRWEERRRERRCGANGSEEVEGAAARATVGRRRQRWDGAWAAEA